MKKERTQKLLLEQLRKMPIIQIACEKVDIARATFYRWRADDKDFAKKVEDALIEGETIVNEMGESQLLSLMWDKHWPSISFWLKHRHPKFKNRLEISGSLQTPQEELTPEQEKTVKEALRLATLTTQNLEDETNQSNS